MLSPDAYKEALEAVSNLTADFIYSANTAHSSHNPEDEKVWKEKSLYITMMYDLLSSMNGIRQIVKVPSPVPSNYKPRIYNPDNG